jgi:hypothetical protein
LNDASHDEFSSSSSEEKKKSTASSVNTTTKQERDGKAPPEGMERWKSNRKHIISDVNEAQRLNKAHETKDEQKDIINRNK